MNKIKLNIDPTDIALPELSPRPSVNKIEIIQLEALIKRLKSYKEILFRCYTILGIADQKYFYHTLKFFELLHIKDIIQIHLAVNEILFDVIDHLSNDIKKYEEDLEKLRDNI